MSRQVRIMSDLALQMALEQLQRAGQWLERQHELRDELNRRKKLRRGKAAA